MSRPWGKCRAQSVLLVTLMLVASAANARKKAPPPPFLYAGGTEQVAAECGGKLEVSTIGLVFKCTSASLDIPFSAITVMEYRPNLSPAVRRLKPNWKVRPRSHRGNMNRYFTILYKEQDQTRVVVLQVEPLVMRPYLAEIELKSGKRVEVYGYEKYD